MADAATRSAAARKAAQARWAKVPPQRRSAIMGGVAAARWRAGTVRVRLAPQGRGGDPHHAAVIVRAPKIAMTGDE